MKPLLTLLFLVIAGWVGAQPEFAELDNHSRKFRKQDYNTPEALAQALCSNLTTDREKARAIFTWIAEYIHYQKVSDPDAKSKKEYFDKLIKQVYRSSRGVCMDYSLLYQRMAQAVGLTCELVEGHAKTFSGSWESHAWNAIKIDGIWKLLDATWGAGYRNEEGHFVQEFQPGYFCTEPRIFLLNHFPEQSKWQLVDTPVTEAEFRKFSHFAYGDLVHGIQDASMQKAQEGLITLQLKIQQPPTYLYVNMGGKDLSVTRKEEDGWTILTFRPNSAQKLEIWGGEKQRAKIRLTLMGQFYRW